MATAQSLLETALDAGMNLVDNADVYGFDWGGTGFGTVEENLGQSPGGRPGTARPHGAGHQGRHHAADPVRLVAGLPPLGVRGVAATDGRRVIDLYQIHRPDLLTHPADVAATLTPLRDEGKIREVGVSNHTPAQVAALAAHLPFPIASNQAGVLGGCTSTRCATAPSTPAWRGHRRARLEPARRRAPCLPVTASGPSCSRVLDSLAAAKASTGPLIAIAFVLAHPAARWRSSDHRTLRASPLSPPRSGSS